MEPIIYYSTELDFKTPVNLFLDPGPTTGYTLTYDGKLSTIGHIKVNSYADFLEFLSYCDPDQIIYEEFYLYPRMTAARKFAKLPEVEIIGIIKLYTEQVGIDLQSQMASSIKNFDKRDIQTHFELTQQQLTELSPHAFDSLRHCFYYQVRGSQQ